MKVGVLGAGSAGSRHIKNALRLSCEVYAYEPSKDISIPGVIQTKRDHVIANADVIVIASPTCYHIDDLWSAVLAKKPCLVEKPIAAIGDSSEVNSALLAAYDDNVPVAVGFNLRLHPMVRWVKSVAQDPYWISLACCQYSENKWEGVLNHWACHEIDLAQHLAGPLRLIHAHITDATADLGFLTYETAKHVHIHSDMRAHSHVRTITVVSDRQSLSIDLEADPVTNDHYKAELSDFLLWAQNPAIKPWILATGWDGWSVLKICERAMYG